MARSKGIPSNFPSFPPHERGAGSQEGRKIRRNPFTSRHLFEFGGDKLEKESLSEIRGNPKIISPKMRVLKKKSERRAKAMLFNFGKVHAGLFSINRARVWETLVKLISKFRTDGQRKTESVRCQNRSES